MRKSYHFHCRECTTIISHNNETSLWKVSRDPDRIEVTDPAEQRIAFSALDQWMSNRETVYGHEIFIHPKTEVG